MSRVASKKLRAILIEHYANEKLFKAIESVYNNNQEMEKLDNEDRRYVETLVKWFIKSGQKLPEAKRIELVDLKKDIVAVENDIKETLASERYTALYTRKELSKLPESFFSGRETTKKNGKTFYVVTMSLKDIAALASIGLCGIGSKLLALNRTQSNVLIALTQKLVTLRTESAKELGYKNYAEYVLTDRMLKSTKEVMELIKQFKQTIKKAKKRQEMQKMTKKNSAKNMFKMLMSKWMPGITDKKVAEYFPLDHVLEQVLQIFQNMFGLHIVKKEGVSTWHKDVQVYEVWEADRSTFVGHMYLDLFMRNHKFNNAGAIQLQAGYTNSDGRRIYPAAALLASFDNPSLSKPSLLTHSDIVVLFHELGHVFHILCSRAKWVSFSGMNVEHEFIETPASMMEHWAWEPFLKEGIENPKTGKEFREMVLGYGATRDAEEGVKQFLGREYNNEAFENMFAQTTQNNDWLKLTANEKL
ncbi:metalloendopeptidase [Coemansia sp. IMI 203386]|nr:metalloendopeptidase [Coemansia sp. IMI 203386]